MPSANQKVIRLMSGFSTNNTVRKWSNVYKCKRKKYDSTILYPSRWFKDKAAFLQHERT